MKGYYKVPFRQVYCEGFIDWVAETFHCHVKIKLFPVKLPDIGGTRGG